MPYTNMWEIVDQNGTIHSGTEEEMRNAFEVMGNGNQDEIAENLNITKEEAGILIEKYFIDWTGDLKLVQIHDIIH